MQVGGAPEMAALSRGLGSDHVSIHLLQHCSPEGTCREQFPTTGELVSITPPTHPASVCTDFMIHGWIT